MTFSSERSGWKVPENEKRSEEEWELEEERRHLKDANNLAGMHIEHLERERRN